MQIRGCKCKLLDAKNVNITNLKGMYSKYTQNLFFHQSVPLSKKKNNEGERENLVRTDDGSREETVREMFCIEKKTILAKHTINTFVNILV